LRTLRRDRHVDERRVAVVGCSLGGRLATFLAAARRRQVAALVSASGTSVLPELHAPSQYQPSWVGPGGVVDAARRFAPKPTLLSYGRNDFPVYAQEWREGITEQLLRPAWRERPRNLRVVRHAEHSPNADDDHTYPLRPVFGFLRRHLRR
jgi:dienelactone hydrolase